MSISELAASLRKRRAAYWYYRLFKALRTFEFAGRRFRYLVHNYNRTWLNERAVEVPIIFHVIARWPGRRMLELGNVLSHYGSVAHDVLDKYEVGEHVINQDVVEYQPSARYDMIVSISTLEHVGWDEQPRDPQKVRAAVAALNRMLVPGGTAVITVPLGYHPHLNEMLRDGSLGFEEQRFLKRISADNRWREVGWNEVEGARYAHPYPYANAIAVCARGCRL